MKRLILLLHLLPQFLFAQKENDKSTNDGWAIHLGAGFIYGGNIGLLMEKQILLNEKFRISPFVSAGFAEGGTDSTSKKYYWGGCAAGVTFEYGKKHRIIFGPHFIGNNVIGNSIEVKKNFLAGTSFIIGYKGTAKCGLIWQLYVGDIYLQEALSDSKKYSHSSQMGLGIGYKF